jgi:radical SAM superfamily enzyme with C-terminal helix-hairpin-helix motif
MEPFYKPFFIFIAYTFYMKVVILDGYVDEPSCLGVPPFISPYVRYTAGAISNAGFDPTYVTIDELRGGSDKVKALDSAKLLVIIGGAIVPGKYLRGAPASVSEIKNIADGFRGITILGGPVARFGFTGERKAKGLENSFDFIVKEDVDAFVYDLISHGSSKDRRRTIKEWREWAFSGSQIIKQHPDFPFPLIIELESYRGCVRYESGGCAFCIEPLFGEPLFREARDIIDEVAALSKMGAVNFRLGAQSCIFTYGACDIGDSETPKPDPETIEKLFFGIRNAAPNLKVLHTDNANPAVISEHPEEAESILKILVKYCTSGNVLALGMESADPKVIKANNLNATPDQVRFAIELINKYGSERGETGMPNLLPGLNFVSGLSGETKRTFKLNYRFLTDILKSNLLLRRINIRQVANVRSSFRSKTTHSDFVRFKKKVREDIDSKMLQLVVPRKTVMRDVLMEKAQGNITFGRQVGTYPLLVGIPYKIPLGKKLDVIISDFGQRSVTGVEYPLKINKASIRALTALPGIGKKRAAQIIRARPFKVREDLFSALDDAEIAQNIIDYFFI